MALSNIFREPRRELTEQAIGTAFLLIYFGIAYLITMKIVHSYALPTDPFLLTLIVGAIAMAMFFLGTGALLGAHAIGQEICDALARAGHDPRPNRVRG